jgi:hypothetical protein
MEQNKHSFILVDGVLKHIKDVPVKPVKRESFESYAGTVYMGGDFGHDKAMRKYNEALQSAIASAVEVSNQEEVKGRLLLSGQHRTHGENGELKESPIYELNCRVEVKLHCNNPQTPGGCSNETCWDLEDCQAKVWLAHVTFEEQIEPATEETQESFDGFVVTIDDGFVAYEYKFPGGNHLSIHQIAEAISSGCGLEIESHKQVKESNP